jgi:hypothetical protein
VARYQDLPIYQAAYGLALQVETYVLTSPHFK